MSAASRPRIAFLFPAFPVLHQTFVLWEVLALRRLGLPITVFSIKRVGSEGQQPEGAELQREVCYLPPTFSAEVLWANLVTLARAPHRYLRAVARLAREWWRDRRRHRRWEDEPGEEDDALSRWLSPTQRLRRFFNRNGVLYLLKSLALVPRAVALGRHLQGAGIERLHAHWASYPATIGLVAAWIFDIPFSFSAHAYDIYLVPYLLPVKVRTACFAVTCARVNLDYLQRMGGAEAAGRVILNYHGVDLERFQPRSEPHADGLPCIITCGRLQLYKGHHVLLRAIARLRRPLRCVVIGEGPQRENLEALAVELGIAERVEFTGPLPQMEVARRYAQADVFVAASVLLGPNERRDVIPNVLVEAMAMQLPVVASAIAGIPELIEDGVTGRLVPHSDVDALGAALAELLDDEALRRRLALAAQRKVVAEFDRSKNIQALADLFLHSTAVLSTGKIGAAQAELAAVSPSRST